MVLRHKNNTDTSTYSYLYLNLFIFYHLNYRPHEESRHMNYTLLYACHLAYTKPDFTTPLDIFGFLLSFYAHTPNSHQYFPTWGRFESY